MSLENDIKHNLKNLEFSFETYSIRNIEYISRIYSYLDEVFFFLNELYHHIDNEEIVEFLDNNFGGSNFKESFNYLQKNQKNLIDKKYFYDKEGNIVTGERIDLKIINANLPKIDNIYSFKNILWSIKSRWNQSLKNNLKHLKFNIQYIQRNIDWVEEYGGDSQWEETLEKFEKSYSILNIFIKKYLNKLLKIKI